MELSLTFLEAFLLGLRIVLKIEHGRITTIYEMGVSKITGIKLFIT